MKILLVLFIVINSNTLWSIEKVKIPGGRFVPMYGIEKNQIDQAVNSFYMDKYPVSEAEFAQFLEKNPKWQKEQVNSSLADKRYLNIQPRKNNFKNPVTYVSWFAAHDFCNKRKGRLPSVLEWEYVHSASEKTANASQDENYNKKLLDWYSRPSVDHDDLIMGKNKPNFYGVSDISQLIWEWTEDFNGVLMTSDNRQDGEKDTGAFCGASSIGARNINDYAAFVRYSLRSSLQASYTLGNLGFRCVYEN